MLYNHNFCKKLNGVYFLDIFSFDNWLNCGESNIIIFKCVTQLGYEFLIFFLLL
jgi:hypothetical protein